LCYSAWLKDEEDIAIQRVSELSGALANLTLDTVEMLQVSVAQFSAVRIFIHLSFGLRSCACWRRGVVVSTVGLISAVNQRWPRLVLGWVTVFGRVSHLHVGMVYSAFYPSWVGKMRISFC